MTKHILIKTAEIFVPTDSDLGTYRTNGADVWNELSALSNNLNVRFGNETFAPIKIEKVDTRDAYVKKLFRTKDLKYCDHLIRFSSAIKSELDENNKTEPNYDTFEYFFECNVKHYLMYMHLAKPGFMNATHGYLLVNESLYNEPVSASKEYFSPPSNEIYEALEAQRNFGWPPIIDLPFRQTFDWLDSHWTAFETLPINRIQRTLNAFSYLFDGNRDTTLIYSLIGLEALFVDGNEGIRKQIDSKTQIVLGERTEFKKLVNELYDYRSRYIHGQLNLTNKFFVDDISEEVWKHKSVTSDNSQLAMLVLIASIQRLIELNRTEYEFELRLRH